MILERSREDFGVLVGGRLGEQKAGHVYAVREKQEAELEKMPRKGSGCAHTSRELELPWEVPHSHQPLMTLLWPRCPALSRCAPGEEQWLFPQPLSLNQLQLLGDFSQTGTTTQPLHPEPFLLPSVARLLVYAKSKQDSLSHLGIAAF